MTRRSGGSRTTSVLSAILLAIAGLVLAALCLRTAAVAVLPPSSPLVMRIAPQHPDVVLARAAADLITRRGILDAATLQAVRRAAVKAPLDARPFLILGHQQLLDRRSERAVKTLEAGQRLDPRDRLIHLLLLDRYLRTARYADAAAQLAVLARLVGPAQAPIAAAVAQMVRAPATREAARRTIRSNADLERAVLTTLARSDTPPAELLALASPAAVRDARGQESWGPVLINRLVARGQYAVARSIWARIHGLSTTQAAALVFDAALQGQPALPPFNWSTAGARVGAADIEDGSLTIDYYGRDNGELVSQLLTLPAGTYRLGFSVEGGRPAAKPALFWSVRCISGSTSDLVRIASDATGSRRRMTGAFVVPAGCPAQRLSLTGEAGEFPTPANVTIRDLQLRVEAQVRP